MNKDLETLESKLGIAHKPEKFFITFKVSGYAEQKIMILPEELNAGITPAKILAGLKSGKYTTVLNDGHIVEVSTDKQVAIVVDSDNYIDKKEFKKR